jgi:hypothetical protein
MVDFSNDSVSIPALRDRFLQAWVELLELKKLLVIVPLVVMNCLNVIHHQDWLKGTEASRNCHEQWTGGA